MSAIYKVPESVLVVIYTQQLEVLLIRRADTEETFWQSVTGSKDYPDEPWAQTAAREVLEETGIDCHDTPSDDPHDLQSRARLSDWCLENVYEIYPRWRHRYAPGVTHNTERVFGLQLPQRFEVRLNPREHTDAIWLHYTEAAQRCYSPSNAEACLWVPRFAAPST